MLLLLGSFARLLGDMNSAAFDMKIISSALTDPFWHTRLSLNVVLFALALLTLHAAFALGCWLLAAASRKAWPHVQCSPKQWVLVWFIGGVTWLLLANAARFAHSSLGEPWHDLATTRVLGATVAGLVTIALIAAILAVLVVLLYRYSAWRRRGVIAGSTVLLAAGVGFTWIGDGRQAAPATAPNVILLGIDSLRPDFINASDAPHMQEFMDGAIRMSDAMTPLARTFPSWMSILSGRHPHTTGAYMNLLPRDHIHEGTTLPALLRQHGYRTYYSMDETRFANIDASYGFDVNITSTMGGSDFVLSWFADTPLSNVVVNSPLGALLFPHVHANRAAHVTYNPDAFVRRVAGAIDSGRPVFLVSHLTLPHWPYIWSDSPATEPNEGNIPDLYTRAVHRADQQFGDLLAALGKRGLLDNAIVIALSDHGEALGKPEDLLEDMYPATSGEMPKSEKWGHGTSVFSPAQYRVVLGARAFGSARALMAGPSVRTEPVSLVDIAPTVLDLLGIESPGGFDGMSLAGLLRSNAPAGEFVDRIRFTETEYNPRGMTSAHLTASALAEAVKIYRLDARTDRLLVRESAIGSILDGREYAAQLGNRALAIAAPDPLHEGEYQLVAIQGNTGDVSRLREALRDRYRLRFSDDQKGGPIS
jgi:hypothetical protein